METVPRPRLRFLEWSRGELVSRLGELMMLPPRSGLILLHVSSERAHLPEYLAELGFDVAQSQWGITDPTPRVIITDQLRQVVADKDLAARIHGGHVGLIVYEGMSRDRADDDIRADATLPTDATGRELALAIDLVSEICEHRRRLVHEQEECQRWINLAMHDALTGLPNRRAWDEQLAERLATKTTLCIGLIDVDFFKHVNDRQGHNAGDTVLRHVARAMRSHVRNGDFVARLGGDEFGVILQDLDESSAESILDRLRRAVSADLSQRNLPSPTLSAGYVLVPPTGSRDATQSFAAAATSLQSAKRQNRDRTVAFQSDPAAP